jgi:hypothetical protein
VAINENIRENSQRIVMKMALIKAANISNG